MNKIKKFLKDNKNEIKVTVYGAGMLIAGIYIGKKIEYKTTTDSLKKLAATKNFGEILIKGEKYFISAIDEVKMMEYINK